MGKRKDTTHDEQHWQGIRAIQAQMRQDSQDLHACTHGCPHGTDGYNADGCSWCDGGGR
jgi:hypothetical protein